MAKDPVKVLQRELRALGWSQNELARRLKTSGAVVSRWMTRVQKPSLVMAARIAKLLPAVTIASWAE